MPVFGADIEELRSLATTCRQKAAVIDSDVVMRLSAEIHFVNWIGPDADRFRDDWMNVLAPQLRNVITVLEAAADRADKNAMEQMAASGEVSAFLNELMGNIGKMFSSVGLGGVFSNIAGAIGGGALPAHASGGFNLIEELGNMKEAVSQGTDPFKPGTIALTFADLVDKGMSLGMEHSGVGKAFGAVGKAFDIVGTVGETAEFARAMATEGTLGKIQAAGNYAGDLLQLTPPGSATWLVGTGMKTYELLGEEVAKIEPWPEGVNFFETVAGGELDENPVVATGQVILGGAKHFWDATCTVFGRIF